MAISKERKQELVNQYVDWLDRSQGLDSYLAAMHELGREVGRMSGRFEYAEDISGERMVELIKARGGKTKEGCHPGCLIQCFQTYHDSKGKYLTSGFEYETIWALGANTLIRNLDEIAMLDRLCDDFLRDGAHRAHGRVFGRAVRQRGPRHAGRRYAHAALQVVPRSVSCQSLVQRAWAEKGICV